MRELNHPTYTIPFLEDWINRYDNVSANAVAALQAMGAKGFYEAIKTMASVKDDHQVLENEDLIVQFSMLWGIEIGKNYYFDFKKKSIMKQYDSIELLELFRKWTTEYLCQSEIEDSVDFFHEKLNSLLTEVKE